jgi:hypothetical protein
MWLTNQSLRGIAFIVAFAAYWWLWDLTELPSPFTSHNYALFALKLFSLLGLLLFAHLVVGWFAKRVQHLREKSREGA